MLWSADVLLQLYVVANICGFHFLCLLYKYFIIIDNKPHLNEQGIDYLCYWVNKLILVTTNKNHIAYSLKEKYNNLEILFYEELDLEKMLEDIYNKYDAKKSQFNLVAV